MRAVIMAGGLGTRMAGLYPGLPKPLIPVGGKPVLRRQIETLVRQGITDITLVTGYLADRIEAAADELALLLVDEVHEQHAPTRQVIHLRNACKYIRMLQFVNLILFHVLYFSRY